MSYADELMSTGEQIQYRTKQHPAIFVYGAPLRDPGRHHRRPPRCGWAAGWTRPD